MAAPGPSQTLDAFSHGPFSYPGAIPSNLAPKANNLPPKPAPLVLPKPVLIPQRRPGAKERGFISAYAPCLGEHGIDQQTFLNFVSACNKALQGSAAIQAVSVAAELISFAPDPTGISNGVGAALGAVAAAAAVLQSTAKTNTFLNKHNEEIFLPRGLFCLIVTHDPTEKNKVEAPSHPPSRPKKSSNGLISQIEAPQWAEKLKDPYRKSSSGLPSDVVPLTFYEDESVSGSGTEAAPKKSGFKKFMGSMDSYLDNRALAQYARKNDGDAIMKSQPRRPEFRNRYLDPTHPATTGGLAGLLSGGTVTDKGLEQVCSLNRLQRQIVAVATKNNKESTSAPVKSIDSIPDQELGEKSMAEARRSLGTSIAGLKIAQDAPERKSGGKDPKAFKKNILYLTIVDLQSVAEFTSRAGEGFGDLMEGLAESMAEGIITL